MEFPTKSIAATKLLSYEMHTDKKKQTHPLRLSVHKGVGLGEYALHSLQFLRLDPKLLGSTCCHTLLLQLLQTERA